MKINALSRAALAVCLSPLCSSFDAWAQSYQTYFPPDTSPIVGVCTGVDPSTDALDQVDAAHLASVRFDLSWESVETVKGTYKMPAGAEAAVNDALSRSMHPVIILDYGNPIYGIQKPRTDAEIAAYLKYASAVVHHFRERVKYFEIWNEWDSTVGTTETVGGTAAEYVKLVKTVYPALKQIAPTAVFMIGSVTYGKLDNGYLDDLLALGALDYGDGLAIHPYIYSRAGGKTPESWIGWMSGISAKVTHVGGATYPIYVTEVGWPTSITDGGVSHSDQANYLARTLLLSKWVGTIKGVWVYQLKDLLNGSGSDPFDKEKNFGLVFTSNVSKQSSQAIADVADLVRNSTRVDRVNLGAADVYDMSYTVKASGGATYRRHVVWSVKDNSAGVHYRLLPNCDSTKATVSIVRAGTGQIYSQACGQAISVDETPLVFDKNLLSLDVLN
jgi:hypothetical protein